jgi:hypothetical protein
MTDVMARLDQFQSEINTKLDALSATDAAPLQRERKWTAAMCIALLCIATAAAATVVYSCRSRL